MKNLKKFAALLLAGAMALLMLTACGGGGGDFVKYQPMPCAKQAHSLGCSSP